MSKHPNNQREPSNLSRWEKSAARRRKEVTLQDLKNERDLLQKYVEALETTIGLAESLRLRVLDVDGGTKFERGILLIREYLTNTNNAIIRS